MTRHLARLADISYRRRGRVVLAWIVATVVIIGVGSSLAGEYNADYNTPGSESKAASELTEERFAGYSGQEIYVVWKDPAGADSAAAKQRIDAFLAKAHRSTTSPSRPRIRVSRDGKIGATTLPMTVAGWDVPKEDGEKLIAAAEANSGDGLRDQARRGSDLRRAGGSQPRRARVPRRRDRAADRVRLGGRRRPAAPDRPRRARDLVRRADRPARQRRRRPRLDDGGLGADRDRRRHRLRAARADPVPRRDERGQGPPRRRRRGRHHRRAQRDHRRHGRGDRRPRPRPDRPALHVRGRASRPRSRCSS